MPEARRQRVTPFRLMWCGLLCALLGSGAQTGYAQESGSELIRTVQSRMVKIFGVGGIARVEGYGTGFLVTPQGHVATIWSPMLDAPEVTVVLDNGRRYPGKVVGVEPRLDLAMLKIDAEDLPCFDLDQDLATAGPGTRVLAFSNMFRVATGNEPVSVMHGVIAAKSRLPARRGRFEIQFPDPVYIVDAITNNSGAAGGILTNRNGQLLAVIGKELRNSESNTWINHALPIESLLGPLQSMIRGDYIPQADPDQTPLARRKLLDPAAWGLILIPDAVVRTPAFVERTLPKTAAAQAGFETSDLILFVNGELVKSCRHFKDLVGRAEPGSQVDIVVRRGGALVPLRVGIPAAE